MLDRLVRHVVAAVVGRLAVLVGIDAKNAESFSMFNSSIMRVIDYYNSRNSDNIVDVIYVTGYAETFIGLTQLMSNELGIPVDRLSDKSSEIFQGLAEGGAYINCIGAAIESMDFIPDVHSDKKGKVRKIGHTGKKGKPVAGTATEKDPTGIALIVLIACLVIAGGLAAYALLPYFAAEKENARLKARDEELTPIREVYYDKIQKQQGSRKQLLYKHFQRFQLPD